MSKKQPPPAPSPSRRALEAMDPERLRDDAGPQGENPRNHFEEDYPGPSKSDEAAPRGRSERRGGR